jgi:hypothetical protein
MVGGAIFPRTIFCFFAQSTPVGLPKQTMKVKRVLISPEAVNMVDTARRLHGELMFHQSSGGCDGSSPMCFPKGGVYHRG